MPWLESNQTQNQYIKCSRKTSIVQKFQQFAILWWGFFKDYKFINTIFQEIYHGAYKFFIICQILDKPNLTLSFKTAKGFCNEHLPFSGRQNFETLIKSKALEVSPEYNDKSERLPISFLNN